MKQLSRRESANEAPPPLQGCLICLLSLMAVCSLGQCIWRVSLTELLPLPGTSQALRVSTTIGGGSSILDGLWGGLERMTPRESFPLRRTSSRTTWRTRVEHEQGVVLTAPDILPVYPSKVFCLRIFLLLPFHPRVSSRRVHASVCSVPVYAQRAGAAVLTTC